MKKLFRYQTIGAFSRDVENAQPNRVFVGHSLASERVYEKDDEAWSGTQTWQEAKDLLVSGDNKSAQLIRTSGQIKAPKRSNKNRPIPTASVYGYLPHIPNYVAGIPTDMITTRQIVHKQKVITIIVAEAVNCGWSAKELADTNAKIVTAIRMIEAGGVRVNLFTYFGAHDGNEEVGALIKIKDSGRYMEIEKMAYAMVNPAFFRRHFFRFLETRQELKNTSWRDGYGYAAGSEQCRKMLQGENVKWHYLCHIGDLKDNTPEEIKAMFEQGN